MNISSAQARVLAEVFNGLSNKEIANKLNISLSTVKEHLRKCYKKLGVMNGRHDLIRREVKMRLIKNPYQRRIA